MLIAVIAAIAAGACFAAAGVLQQRAASRLDSDESLSPALLRDLARQRLWVVGISLAVLSYGFQGLALANGPLSLVQPLIVMEVVFALPVAARLHGMRMQARDWLGALMVTAGLAVGLAAASPSEGTTEAPLDDWLFLLLAVGVLVVAALVFGRRRKGPLRATMFALAGASVMGTQSALFDATIDRFSDGFAAVFTAWQTYLLVVASIGGLLLIQSAFNSGPLVASMPVIDAVEPAVAVTIGVMLFGESLAPGVGRHLLAACGAAVALAGIVVLDTSPLTQRLHQSEEDDKGDDDHDRDHEGEGGTDGERAPTAVASVIRPSPIADVTTAGSGATRPRRLRAPSRRGWVRR
ncbi:DMT family transporter [Modestobacter sp. VKM Ac-2983]|uniref:DMT family transporter n=1 Tax=Modestobacter sp. VKM Ac-2983 TaxID=3004137 RepID=UPI0022AB5C1A|nr:DMT family transporter [Modestobacter sp. VKM Ac-2983]MCZ2805417.1 DMT family transporter [Modestobacter sp. VKM Ac-2983]